MCVSVQFCLCFIDFRLCCCAWFLKLMPLCVCVMVHAHRETYASGFVSRSDPLSCTGNTNRSQRTKWGTDGVFGDMGTQCELEHLGCTDHIYYISVNTIRIKGSFSLSYSLLDFTLISALFVFQFVSVDGCTFLEPLSTTILAIFTQLWHTSTVSLHTTFPLCNSESKNYFWVLLLHFLRVLLW